MPVLIYTSKKKRPSINFCYYSHQAIICLLKNYLYVSDEKSHFKDSGHSDYFWSTYQETCSSKGIVFSEASACNIFSQQRKQIECYLQVCPELACFFFFLPTLDIQCFNVFLPDLFPFQITAISVIRTQEIGEHFLWGSTLCLSRGHQTSSWKSSLKMLCCCHFCLATEGFKGATWPPVGRTLLKLIGLSEYTDLKNMTSAYEQEHIPTLVLSGGICPLRSAEYNGHQWA